MSSIAKGLVGCGTPLGMPLHLHRCMCVCVASAWGLPLCQWSLSRDVTASGSFQGPHVRNHHHNHHYHRRHRGLLPHHDQMTMVITISSNRSSNSKAKGVRSSFGCQCKALFGEGIVLDLSRWNHTHVLTPQRGAFLMHGCADHPSHQVWLKGASDDS